MNTQLFAIIMVILLLGRLLSWRSALWIVTLRSFNAGGDDPQKHGDLDNHAFWERAFWGGEQGTTPIGW